MRVYQYMGKQKPIHVRHLVVLVAITAILMSIYASFLKPVSRDEAIHLARDFLAKRHKALEINSYRITAERLGYREYWLVEFLQKDEIVFLVKVQDRWHVKSFENE